MTLTSACDGVLFALIHLCPPLPRRNWSKEMAQVIADAREPCILVDLQFQDGEMIAWLRPSGQSTFKLSWHSHAAALFKFAAGFHLVLQGKGWTCISGAEAKAWMWIRDIAASCAGSSNSHVYQQFFFYQVSHFSGDIYRLCCHSSPKYWLQVGIRIWIWRPIR